MFLLQLEYSLVKHNDSTMEKNKHQDDPEKYGYWNAVFKLPQSDRLPTIIKSHAHNLKSRLRKKVADKKNFVADKKIVVDKKESRG